MIGLVENGVFVIEKVLVVVEVIEFGIEVFVVLVEIVVFEFIV